MRMEARRAKTCRRQGLVNDSHSCKGMPHPCPPLAIVGMLENTVQCHKVIVMSFSLLSRYAFFVCCVLFTLVTLPFVHQHEWLWPFTLVIGALSLLGVFDLLQSHHAVRRNYPILGNIRYLIEGIRPEIRQYLLEADDEATPFSRAQRALVYSRAKAKLPISRSAR